MKRPSNAKTQHQDLSLTASTLAAASPEELKQLSQDQALSPDMQSLATSALEFKKQGGTEEEQAAKIVAKATEEWGVAATTIYYTLGAPVTFPYELIKGLYNMGAWMLGGSKPVAPQKDDQLQGETPAVTVASSELQITEQTTTVESEKATTTNTSKKKKKKKKEKDPAKLEAMKKAAELAREKKDAQESLEKEAQETLEKREARLKKDLQNLLEKLKEVRSEKAKAQQPGTKGNDRKKH